MVPPVSHRVSRVRRYSGTRLTEIGFRLRGSHPLWPAFPCRSANLSCRCVGPQPRRINPSVCPLPRSLATTSGISVDFSSSPYLDVSVQAVPHVRLFDSTHADRVLLCRVSPFGNLRVKAYVQLTAAYRSLSRPSSAPDAKAFPLCSSSLELLCTSSDILCVLVCLNCCVSRFTVTFFASKIVFFVYPILRKDLLFSLSFFVYLFVYFFSLFGFQ